MIENHSESGPVIVGVDGSQRSVWRVYMHWRSGKRRR